VVDCAGECGGDAILDCASECGGSAILDECGVCNGDGIDEGACDCAGNVLDCLGECGGDAVVDCSGECGGDAMVDVCGVCDGGNSDCSPSIISIDDFPDDQGGVAILTFSASAADNSGLSRSSAEIYTVEACPLASSTLCDSQGGWLAIPSAGAAYGAEVYSYTVAAITQTVGGSEQWLYRVIAAMEEGNWASNSQSGYSVDNIAPGISGQIAANYNSSNQSINIEWDSIDALDLDYYNLYVKEGEDQDYSISYAGIDNSYIDSNIELGTTYYYYVTGVDIHGNEGLASGIADESGETLSIGDELPNSFMLYSAYPNPFNPNTTIKFDISKASNVNIEIYDANGGYVESILSNIVTPGSYQIDWNASNLPSGIYFIHMNVGSDIFTEKVLLLK
jgi:hypothetical protein